MPLLTHSWHEAQAPEHYHTLASLRAQAAVVVMVGYTVHAGAAAVQQAASTRMWGSVRTTAVVSSYAIDAPSCDQLQKGAGTRTCQKPAVPTPRTRDSRNATATCSTSGSTAGGATVAGHWITNSADG